MNSFQRFPFQTMAVIACVAAAWPSQAQAPARINPADTYFKGYLELDKGLKIFQAGDYAGAYYKFKDASDLFDSVFATDPNWQPEIVEYRRKKTRELLEEAKQKEIERRKKTAAAKGTINPTVPSEAIESVPRAIPMTTPPSQPRSTDVVLQEKSNDLKIRLKELEDKNALLQREIGARDQQLRDAGGKMLDVQKSQTALLERLKTTEAKLDTADATKKREQADLKKQVANLTKERDDLKVRLTETTTMLKESSENNLKLLDEVQKAYAQVKAISEERDALGKEKAAMEEMLAGTASSSEQSKKFAANNSRLQKMLEELQSKVKTLQKERDEAKASEATLRKQAEEDQKVIAQLRGELDTARTELTTLKQQNTDYEEQMAALQARLSATEKVLGEAGVGEGMSDSDAMRENALLHQIVLKMVKQQAGRMKAKEQAVQLLEQSDKLSGDLAKALNEMATPYQMTAAERAVFQAGGGVPAPGAESGTGIQIEIVGDVGGNPTPGVPRDPLGAKDRNSLPPELKAFATAAETHFRNLEFEEAERSYLKILEDEPRNIHSLCNVAVVQLRQNKLKEAEVHIKKAQAYDYQNDFPHYLLGVVHLRQGRYQESLDSVNEGLKIKPDNAEGYLALGFIYIQMKKYAEAEQAFAQAVKLNPNSADAHYNLAVLYTLSETPNLNLAKVHYRKALENGAAPDSRLGKLLEM